MFKYKNVTMALLLICLMLMGACGSNAKGEIDLTGFRADDGEYMFERLPWGSALEDVKKQLPYSLEEVEGMSGETAAGQKFVLYRSKESFDLNGLKWKVELEFYDALLQYASYSTEMETYDESVLDELIKQLTDIYGETSKDADNENEMFESTSCYWNGKSTSLYCGRLTQKGGSTSIKIQLGVLGQ